VNVNVSKELSKFSFAVATDHLAEPLVFLGLENSDGHLRLGHLRAGRRLVHARRLPRDARFRDHPGHPHISSVLDSTTRHASDAARERDLAIRCTM
jgi:hypothetical protein